MINAQESAGVQISFYGAYAVLAIFASILLEEFSYKVGVLIGLGFYIIGALGYIPAALLQDFDIYLAAIFILAGGLSILETSCNPFVLSMGDQSTSVRRLNLAQAFNPIGSLAGIFLAKYFILAHLNDADIGTRKAMSPEQLNAIVSEELFWVCVPYVGLVAIAAIIWFFFARFRLPESEASQNVDNKKESLSQKLGRLGLCIILILIPFLFQYYSPFEFTMVQQILIMMLGPISFLFIIKSYRLQLFKLLRLPRYSFGVIAQFFYVGVQITVWTWTIKYIMAVFPGMQEASAANYYIFSIILFIVCRALTTALMKKFNPASMMSLFALGGIACCLGTMYLPSDFSVWALVGISGCMSLMFPTIYGIALRGLGSEVKLGAAGLIMAILGGAVITPYMGSFIDRETNEDQVQYLLSIDQTLLAEAEEQAPQKSISNAILALHQMTQDDNNKDFAEHLNHFLSLRELHAEEFEKQARTLPGCVGLTDKEMARFKSNVRNMPTPIDEAERLRQFTLIPLLSEFDPEKREQFDELLNNPIDMDQFRHDQETISEKAVRTSFFIPIICFVVILLYGLSFRNVHTSEE
jgi:FHS family L-fucose permease-like MFS transporter